MTSGTPIVRGEPYQFDRVAIVDAGGVVLRVIVTSNVDVVALNTPLGCQAISPPPPDQNYQWNGTEWIAPG